MYSSYEMHYVYVIRSVINPEKIYVGCTIDLEERIAAHNSGRSPHTEKYKPWKLIVYLGFQEKIAAIEFEKYLKSGSGRALIAKRFLLSDAE